MITIHLSDLEFNAFHGMHPEEAIVGATFRVNCELTFPVFDKVVAIDETIDYLKVYEIIKRKMNVPARLLETLIMEIGEELENEFPQIKSLFLKIEKLNPPITGFRGKVAVQWQKTF